MVVVEPKNLAVLEFEGSTNAHTSVAHRIGSKLRSIRKQSGLTLDAVAKQSGLSLAHVSQIENGKVSASLESLEKVSGVLNIPFSSLFVSEEFRSHKTSPADRLVIRMGTGDKPPGQKFIHLLSAPNRKLELVLLELPAGSTSGPPDEGHEGEEAVYLIEGKVRITIGDQPTELSPGDSLHWDATLRHQTENIGKKTAKLVFARTPPGFVDLLQSEQNDLHATNAQEKS